MSMEGWGTGGFPPVPHPPTLFNKEHEIYINLKHKNKLELIFRDICSRLTIRVGLE